jgi:hypothetical protein
LTKVLTEETAIQMGHRLTTDTSRSIWAGNISGESS